MNGQHFALVLVSVDFILGVERFKILSQEMKEIGRILSASSIYKRYLNERLEDLNSELVMVMKIETEKTETELFQFFNLKESTEDRIRPGRGEAFLLLSYDQLTRMVPGQNLPHILLRADGLILRCAAEAWGDYQHPVLGQSLNDVVGSQPELSSVEFFSQFLI